MASPHTSSEFGPISGDMNILGNHFTGSSLTINPPDRNDDYLQHLRRINPRDDKDRIQQIKGGLLEDAYDWILEHADYKRWLDDPNSHLLWVKGDPGKGKTMLLCGVVDELQKSASKSSNPSLVSYFFCQATDQRLNNAKNVLLGLVFLLVNQQKSLLSHFHELYGREGKELFDDINAWVALTRIFRAILADPRLPRTILLVDALDECETDLENLLRLISETSSPASSSKVKWIVSSRYKSMIDEEFRTVSHKIALSLEDNTALISHAVRTYINRKVEDLAARKPYDNSLKNYVESYLIQNANDTFLWVALVCGQLMESQVTTRSTRQRLGSFPPGLDSFYERMLIQIGETDDANRCKRILATTLIAFEPLTIEELRALDDTFRDDTDDDMEAVIANSGSFLTIRDRLVYFVHQSARDFLLNKASHEILPDGVQRKHLSIFSQSLQILSEVLRRDLYDLNNPGIFVDEIHKPSPDPLAAVRYSCVYWVDHFIDGQIHGDMHCELDLRDGGRIYTFIRQKYLYWLEALGLLGHVSHGILSIARLEGLPQMGTQLRDFIRDASRFIQYFKHAIETSPLQVYASGLAFAPEKSKIWDLFQKEMYHWIRLKPNVPPDWNGRLQTLGDGFHALSAAFSPDSKLLASGSNDGKVMVWLVSTGALRHFLEHDGLVWSVAFSPDQKLLASGSSSPNQKVLALEPSSSTVRIWSAVTGALKHHFSDTGDIDLVVFSPDSKMLASCSHGSKVRVWSIATGTLQHALQHREVQSVAFSSSSTLLAAASTNEIQVWSTATGILQRTVKLSIDDGSFESVAFSPDFKLLALGSPYLVHIWSTDTGASQQTFETPHRNPCSVAFSADSKFLAAGGGGDIRIWSVATGTLLHRFFPVNFSMPIAFSPDSKLLASSSGRHIQLWSTATSTLQPNPEAIRSKPSVFLAFSFDLELLASACGGDEIQIRSTTTGVLTQTFPDDFAGSITAMVFSPDSTLLAWYSPYLYPKIKIWSIVSNRLQHVFKPGHVASMAFSHDSKLLALRLYGGETHIWSAVTGRQQGVLEYNNDDIISSMFTFSNQESDYGYDDRGWITFRRNRLLWIPKDFQPSRYTISGSTIAIQSYSGTVVGLGLNAGNLAS